MCKTCRRPFALACSRALCPLMVTYPPTPHRRPNEWRPILSWVELRVRWSQRRRCVGTCHATALCSLLFLLVNSKLFAQLQASSLSRDACEGQRPRAASPSVTCQYTKFCRGLVPRQNAVPLSLHKNFFPDSDVSLGRSLPPVQNCPLLRVSQKVGNKVPNKALLAGR